MRGNAELLGAFHAAKLSSGDQANRIAQGPVYRWAVGRRCGQTRVSGLRPSRFSTRFTLFLISGFGAILFFARLTMSDELSG